MAGNIIPAIATTNAMIAGLCVMQAFKVMRNELNKAKMVFLTRGTERVILSEPLQPPNPNCPACSVAQATLTVDTSRATLNDLVESLLKMQLGYKGEFSVNSEAGVLYDPEEDQHLDKTFEELGLKADSSLTVIDEEDVDPKVNVVFNLDEKTLDKDVLPIRLEGKLKIASKPKTAPPPTVQTNGHAQTNGVNGTASVNSSKKRSADEAKLEVEDENVKKRGKVAAIPDDDIVMVEDSNGGVILIDDD